MYIFTALYRLSHFVIYAIYIYDFSLILCFYDLLHILIFSCSWVICLFNLKCTYFKVRTTYSDRQGPVIYLFIYFQNSSGMQSVYNQYFNIHYIVSRKRLKGLSLVLAGS